jgi:elongation factor Ts
LDFDELDKDTGAMATPVATPISAGMVKELRDQTGAGMMDCKAALSESGGNLEAAVDWLRKKGLSKAAKKAGRVAAEGLIGVGLAANKGVLVEVNSETDFVARNDLFQGLVKMIASAAIGTGPDLEKILKAPIGGITVQDAIADTIAKVGENMTLRRAAELAVGKGVVASYVHSSVIDGLGRIGVIVGLESAGQTDELKAFGRMVAMHVAAANPQAVDSSGLDPAIIGREKAVLAAKAEGKPANVVEKIVESGLKTFYKEVCLLDQGFVIEEGKKSVAQAVKEAEAKVGAPIKIAGFVRFALGEGIERPSDDFGGEVAALAGTH